MDDDIEVTMHDGTIRKFKKEELKQKMENDMQGTNASHPSESFQLNNDWLCESFTYICQLGVTFDGKKMKRETEGETNLSDLAKTNPDMARFIAIGRWYTYVTQVSKS